MAEEGAKAGMSVHGNEYHDPDFEQEGAAAALVEAHRTTQVHTQDQPPAEHGNAKHNPDFEQEGVAASLVGTHEAKTTGIHGVGGSTVESASGSQGKVDTHEAKTTGIHGVGTGTVAKVGDIAIDTNLSAAGQDAVSKRHTQNTDKTLVDADGDTKIQVEESADEDEIRMDVKGVEVFELHNEGVLTLAKQAGARAYLNSNQTLATDTLAVVNLAAENFDRQEEFNTSTYKYVAKRAGLYLVTAEVTYSDLSDQKGGCAIILLNGGIYLILSTYLSSSVAAYLCPVCTDIVQLAVNDYIQLGAYHTKGSNATILAGSNRTFLAIMKIG
jgi:hypothetical protein